MTQRIFVLLVIVLLASSNVVPVLATAPAAVASKLAPEALQSALAFCDDVSGIPPSECLALAALYASTGGASWTNKAGWMDSLTPCSWYGVICAGGHVNTLNLGSNNLTGALPPELGNLSELDTIDFDSNNLTGNIPPEMGGLAHLRVISMTYNNLSGALPSTMGSLGQLQEMWLRHNQISGAIPPEFGGLSNLRIIDLAYNQLNQPLPSQLGSLSSLTDIMLQNNQINGSIPPQLGNLKNLASLGLSNNQLSGSLPPELGRMTSLKYLIINTNHLVGSIPPEFGNLTNLIVLNLICNRLSGSIPAELGNLKAVTQLSLNGNQLEGEIPAALTQMTALAAPFVDLGYNRLTASDPAAIAWLNTNDPDWAATQTVTPTGLHASGFTADSVTLAWTPIAYTGDGGYYEVYQATFPSGPYSLTGHTTDKTFSSYTASIPPGSTVFFTVRTYTPAHDFVMIGPGWTLHQQNELFSAPTPALPVTIAQVDPGSGGTMTSMDSSGSLTQVAAPAGAVSESVTLTLVEPIVKPAPTVGLMFARHAFDLNAYANGILQTGFVFTQPVTVTLHYTDADITGIDEDSLTLYFAGSSQWVDAAESCTPVLTYERHPNENWLSVPICHLSQFALFGEPEYFNYLPVVIH